MKIAVINLVRSTDRRERIEANLAQVGLAFEFFNGIDARYGEHLGVSRYSEAAALREFHRPLSAGEVGCFASHYLLWQRCVEARKPFVIIEDDALLDDGFVRTLETVSELISTFPLLRLGLTAEGAGSGVVLPLPQGFEVVSLAPGTYGTQCYILSDIAAKALVDHAAVWSFPVDIYLDRPQIHGLDSYGLRPYFVRHADQSVYPSVIGDERYGLWPEDPLVKIRAIVERFLAERGRRLK